MKDQIFKLAGVLLACVVITSCGSDGPVDTSGNSGAASSGDADFSKFVAIGDSLTAGYADGALYLLGQKNSYPAILAQQFAVVGGGSFTQPLVSDNLGGLVFNGAFIPDLSGNNDYDNRLVLNTETQKPERLVGLAATEVNGSGLNGMTFNNMGVPGAKSFHLDSPGYGNTAGVLAGLTNPYFSRFSSVPASATVIGDAAAQLPSFFVLWIGNNDVLSFATSGGIGIDQTGLGNPFTAYGLKDITDPTAFAGVYANLVGALTAANPTVKGVLVNIPDVSTIPFFTTVPYNPIPLDQVNADALNAAYGAYNAGLQALVGVAPGFTQQEADARTISFAVGQNAVVILDEDLTDLTGINAALLNMRQTTANDLIVLPTSAKLGVESVPGNSQTVWGLGTPLEDGDVLTATEIASINTARTAYNAAIKAAADANTNLVYVDVEAIMVQLSTTGLDFGSGTINSDFATGGAFSLDGVHPTARGYAVIANAIIDAINGGFNANVHKVDPAAYPSIFLK